MSRYFNEDEVHQLIPQLQYHFSKLIQSKQAMGRLSFKLKKLGFEPQLLGILSQEENLEAYALQAKIKIYYEQFKDHLFAIEQMGGQIKDLELGRVDFPSQVASQPGFFTWQLGLTDRPVFLSA
ncbi:MAG: DUF2203 family protein [Deltaproteobacteria bacterium]|nr:DUF2203 family protein [Deltaproteobacteria bacterium]